MSYPTISVVMAAYNVEKYIGEAIESIKKQSFNDWELIIVDDCSKDATYTIAQKYAANDTRIKLIKRNTNSGGCRIPRFDAIMEARGKWVCSIDADDIIENEMFSKLLHRQEETGADMILSRIVICGEDLSPSKTLLPCAGFDMSQIISGREAVEYTINGWRISVTSALINTIVYQQYLSKIDWSSFNGPFSDELDHRKMLLTASKIAFVDAYYYYRQQPQSIVHNKSAKSFSGIRNMINLLDFVTELSGGDQILLQQMHIEYLNRIYRYQVDFVFNNKIYSHRECHEIKNMIKTSYDRIRSDKMRFQGIKQRLLSYNFLMFKCVAFLAAKYLWYKQLK